MQIRKKRITIIAILIIILIILAIAATYRKPEVDIVDINIEGIKTNAVILKVDLNVKNDNLIGGKLQKTNGDVYFDGKYIGPFYSTESFEIRAMGISSINVNWDVEKFVSSKPKEVRVIGIATITIGIFTFDVNFDERKSY